MRRGGGAQRIMLGPAEDVIVDAGQRITIHPDHHE